MDQISKHERKRKKLPAILPHIGMRKIKSVLAVFTGFWFWQLIRLFFPSLEVHPIYIYIYGVIEMRENSEKTADLGPRRVKATCVAVSIGIPILFLSDILKVWVMPDWSHMAVELVLLLLGVLLTLEVAEKMQCGVYCGLTAAIFIILMVSHSNDEVLIYAVLRAIQTIGGVFIAWLINVKLFPYPAEKAAEKRKEREAEQLAQQQESSSNQ